MSNTPSKAEILALAQQHLKAFAQFTGAGEVWFEGEVEFARAVLAKWGQPAQAAEPVAWLNPWRADQVTTDYDAYGKHGIPLVRQQPVGREPLSEQDEREAVARAIWELMREQEDRCDMELDDLMEDHPIWSYADAAIAAQRDTP